MTAAVIPIEPWRILRSVEQTQASLFPSVHVADFQAEIGRICWSIDATPCKRLGGKRNSRTALGEMLFSPSLAG